MSYTFPSITPHFIRTITLADYTSSKGDWKSGDTSNIRTGYQGVNTLLALEYQGLSDTQFYSFLQFIDNIKGTATSFLLPSNFYNLINESAKNSILNIGSTTRWKFSQLPNFNVIIASSNQGRYKSSMIIRSVTI